MARGGLRRDDLALHAVVGHFQQAGDEQAIDCLAFGRHHLARGAGRHLLAHETALRAGRHDDGVLDHLRLHQAQHLGAVVFHAVRPPQAAAGDRATAQVHAFEAAREHVDLAEWTRLGRQRQVACVDLEDDLLAGVLEVVGAHGGQRQVDQCAHDLFGVGVVHARQAGLEGVQPGAAFVTLLVGQGRIEAQDEAGDEFLDQGRLGAQRLGHVAHRELGAELAPVADVGAHQLHFAHGQAAFDGQAVHAAVFGLVVEQGAEQFLGDVGDARLGQLGRALGVDRQRGHVAAHAIQAGVAVGLLAVDRDAGVLQRRQDARQRRHGLARIQADRGAGGVIVLDAGGHAVRAALGEQRVDVAERGFGRGGGHEVDRQGRHDLAHQAALAALVDRVDQLGEAVMPAIEHAQQRTLDVGFQVERIARRMRDQVDARQRAVGHQGLDVDVARARAFLEGSGQARCDRIAEALARQVDQHVQVALVNVAACEDLRARLLVQRDHRAAHFGQPFRLGFQRFVTRQRLEDLDEFLGAEAFLAHAGDRQHARHAAARERQARQRGRGGGAGEQADEAVLAQDLALRVQVAHADEVQRRVAVQGTGHVGLHDRQVLGAQRQGFEVARDAGQAGAVDRMVSVLQHADAARDVAFEFARARLDDVVGVAERLIAFVLGPFEEGGDFLAFRGAGSGCSGGHGGHAVAHGDGVALHGGGVIGDHAQARGQLVQFFELQFVVQQAQDDRLQRAAGFADRDHGAVAVAAHRQHGVHHAGGGDALAAQSHDEGVDQVGTVIVQNQECGGGAAAAIEVAHGGDLGAGAAALGQLREPFHQYRRQALRRGAGQVFVVERSEPGGDQGIDLRAVGGLVCTDQRERLVAQIVGHVFHLASPKLCAWCADSSWPDAALLIWDRDLPPEYYIVTNRTAPAIRGCG